MRLLSLICVCVLLMIGLYVALFASWWFRSPSRVVSVGGRNVHVVEFQFNWLSSRTEPLWTPAFWFMEHACGYSEQGYIALYDDSRIVYAK